MSNSPTDDQRLDNDRTDELPVLLETVVLDAEDPRLPLAETLEETGEHTAHYPAAALAETADIEALKHDLAARGTKIEALQADITKLSARWADVERHLTHKDLLIKDLKEALAELRASVTERSAALQRRATEAQDRDAQRNRLVEELEQRRRESTQHAAEIAELRATAGTARDEAANLRGQIAAEAAAGRDASELAELREELATLTAYIANRRTSWNELEARATASATRVRELERELADRATRQQVAERLAQHETARATALRAELVEQARLVETLHRERAAARTAHPESALATAGLSAELGAARDAANQTALELAAVRESHAAQLAGLRARQAESAGAHGATAAGRDVRPLPGAAAVVTPPAHAFEVIAQLEAEVEHKRQQVSAQLAELRDRDNRLAAAEQRLEAGRLDLGSARRDLEQARTDAARLERALLDKDRALEARDARIATLQEELSQRLGALQKLNAMDLSLQGLDSKMSERLRRNESPATDHANTPALVCLTGDAPKQFALTKKAITLGRGSHCDVQILTHFVSREHARITVNRGSAVIEDLGSTNGVFVNAIRIDRHELRQGDLITVGETQFRFLESMAH